MLHIGSSNLRSLGVMSSPENTEKTGEGQEENVHIEIPEPAGLPFLGNIAAIDSEFPLGSMKSLADQYGLFSITKSNVYN